MSNSGKAPRSPKATNEQESKLFNEAKLSNKKGQDFHEKSFESSTILKLDLFEKYAEAWIPTFVMNPKYKEIHIYDFFAGPGYDSNRIPGSPIRLLTKIFDQENNILKMGTKIVLHLNEFDTDKFIELKDNCDAYFKDKPQLKDQLELKYFNKSTEVLFFELLPQRNNFPSLIYLDQFGIKFINSKFIETLEKLDTTDFMYFISSSYFQRFGHTSEFKNILPVPEDEIKKWKHHESHRNLVDKIKELLPKNSKLKLFPFSIKKEAQIYGIMFGAKHPLAFDKFLRLAWKQNFVNGEADFDIDQDSMKSQLVLFGGKSLTKIDKFKQDFEQKVLIGEIKTNEDALLYAYSCGHIHTHAEDVIKKLKNEGVIAFNGPTPALNYENVFKKRNIVTYTLTKSK